MPIRDRSSPTYPTAPMIRVPLKEIPDGGLHLTGEVARSVFSLPPHDPAEAHSPLRYDLHVELHGDNLSITGEVSADFLLQCGRCLEKFAQRIELAGYRLDRPVENESIIDLTEPIREDILLALPGYPRCEDSNLESRTCPAADLTKQVADAGPADDSSSPNVWSALDDLKTDETDS
ncbi:hypothetical protein BH23VER1_BH23VER1_25500 [soil metagenome]